MYARGLQPVFRHLAIGALALQWKFNEESGNTAVPPMQSYSNSGVCIVHPFIFLFILSLTGITRTRKEGFAF